MSYRGVSRDENTNYEDCIANNIPSRAYRYATENKNSLIKEGAMYVGSGKTRITSMNYSESSSDSWDSYITNVLVPPTSHGKYVLVANVTSNGVVVGWVPASAPSTGSFVSQAESVADAISHLNN